MKALSVLVADDSLITSDKIGKMLENMGHRVIAIVGTGEAAIEAYRQHRPDLVTMDITMPGMNGVDATRHIVEKFPDAVIVMVTSHGQEKMVLAAIGAGAKGYVLKPIRSEKLGETIVNAINYHAGAATSL